MLYFNRDGRLTVPDVLDPVIIAENPQGLGNRLVDAASTNFNRMFNFLKIETGNFARLQRHIDDLSYSFFLRQECEGCFATGATVVRDVASTNFNHMFNFYSEEAKVSGG
jgi:hypothetical protein